MFLTLRRRIQRLEARFDRLFPPPEEEEENDFVGMSDEEVDAVLHRQAVAVQEQATDPDQRDLCQAVIDRKRILGCLHGEQEGMNIAKDRLVLLDVGRAVERREQIGHVDALGIGVDAACPASLSKNHSTPPVARDGVNSFRRKQSSAARSAD